MEMKMATRGGYGALEDATRRRYHRRYGRYPLEHQDQLTRAHLVIVNARVSVPGSESLQRHPRKRM